MKLKTLKDIVTKLELGDNNWDGALSELSDNLKQEAIKHIKDLENQPKDNKDDFHIYSYAIIKWIKHFFNITEEDLK